MAGLISRITGIVILSLTISFGVFGCGGDGTGGGTTLSAPTGLVASAVSSSWISLTWNASVSSGVTGYKVYRDGSLVGNTGSTTYDDTSLNTSTEYCYAVTAVDGTGAESAKSVQSCAMTDGPLTTSTWARTFNNGGISATPTAVEQTTDSGYILAGATKSSSISTNVAGWIIKLDSDGNVTWQRTYGGINGDWISSIQQTPDGGYIAAGDRDTLGTLGRVFWVMKLNSAGGVTWQRVYYKYGFGGNDNANSLDQTTDGGYIVAGLRHSYSSTNSNLRLMKLDSNGNNTWQRDYGGIYQDDSANSVQQTADGGFIVAGSTDSFGNAHAGAGNVWILKLDAAYNISWQKTYGESGLESANSIQQTTDGGYIVAGHTFSRTYPNNNDMWVLKLDSNGNVMWQKSYGDAGQDVAYSTRQTADGGYIVAGYTSSFGAGGSDIWVLKLDSNGDVVWQKTYGGALSETAASVRQTSDGGYIVAGTNGAGEFLVLKLDANGRIGGSCALVATSSTAPAVTVVAPQTSASSAYYDGIIGVASTAASSISAGTSATQCSSP